MRVALLSWLPVGPAMAQGLSEARFPEITTRYAHGVFGETEEWDALEMVTETGKPRLVRLVGIRVFGDTAPRLADVDGDGTMEAVIETDAGQGARLSVYGPERLIAATPYIGTSQRWLAPLPPANLDGDGRIELVYVDWPHLAQVLRVWRLQDGALGQVAAGGAAQSPLRRAQYLGGVRDCGKGPELVFADAAWRRIMAVRLAEGALSAREIGPLDDAGLGPALGCVD